VGWPEACLVDVYDTLLRCDFSVHREEMTALAGVPADSWQEAYWRVDRGLNTGQISKAEGFAQILRENGVEPGADLVRALVDRDEELLRATARMFDDAIPFLERLRSRGIKIAIVSNCTASTRPLLAELGVTALADALVLSCEVGAVKPQAEIFSCALERVGVTAAGALFVDDQPAYCAGAMALGIAAAQIVRGELDGRVSAAGATVVRSLTEVEAMLSA
jgi:putative hydrolase of the HAD superfamily